MLERRAQATAREEGAPSKCGHGRPLRGLPGSARRGVPWTRQTEERRQAPQARRCLQALVQLGGPKQRPAPREIRPSSSGALPRGVALEPHRPSRKPGEGRARPRISARPGARESRRWGGSKGEIDRRPHGRYRKGRSVRRGAPESACSGPSPRANAASTGKSTGWVSEDRSMRTFARKVGRDAS